MIPDPTRLFKTITQLSDTPKQKRAGEHSARDIQHVSSGSPKQRPNSTSTRVLASHCEENTSTTSISNLSQSSKQSENLGIFQNITQLFRKNVQDTAQGGISYSNQYPDLTHPAALKPTETKIYYSDERILSDDGVNIPIWGRFVGGAEMREDFQKALCNIIADGIDPKNEDEYYCQAYKDLTRKRVNKVRDIEVRFNDVDISKSKDQKEQVDAYVDKLFYEMTGSTISDINLRRSIVALLGQTAFNQLNASFVMDAPKGGLFVAGGEQVMVIGERVESASVYNFRLILSNDPNSTCFCIRSTGNQENPGIPYEGQGVTFANTASVILSIEGNQLRIGTVERLTADYDIRLLPTTGGQS